MQRNSFPWPAFLLIVVYGIWGLGWGLPSEQRNSLFLNPQLRTPEFYEKVSAAREDLYRKMGGDSIAYLGQLSRANQMNTLPTLLNTYSTFMLKTHNMDEAVVLVMLSHLNPLHNRWYPHSFVYGGAYLYPLAAYLGACHLVGAVHLISSTTFYLMHPSEMARLYIATRVWSLLGFWLTAIVLYFLAGELCSAEVAPWAMLFFGIAPVFAFSKVTKPHTWASFLTLSGIYFVVKAKENPESKKWLIWASVAFGLSIGHTVTQSVFLPFLLWACWTNEWHSRVPQILFAFSLVAFCYIGTNFYMVNHWATFKDEHFLIDHYSTFQIRLGALWEFLSIPLLSAMGHALWTLSWGGIILVMFKNNQRRLKIVLGILGFSIVIASFKLQGFMEPYIIRWFIAMIPLLCLVAAWATFQWPRYGRAVRWGCLGLLVAQASLYNLHLASDKAPEDNGSRAAIWMSQHVAPQTMIAQSEGMPQLNFFPPVDFSRYRFCSFESEEFRSFQGPLYAVISGPEDKQRKMLLANHFVLVQRFANTTLQRLGFDDPFLNANYVVEIYLKTALS